MLYTLVTGSYGSLYQKSRLDEATNTFITSLLGCTFIFFAIVINDPVKDYHYFYKTYFIFLFAHFILTVTGRVLILTLVRSQVLRGKIIFNALLVGCDDIATRVYKESREGLASSGYHYAGLASAISTTKTTMASPVTCPISAIRPRSKGRSTGTISIRLDVVALERSARTEVETIVERLSNKDVRIKIIPSTLDILSGSVRTSNVFGVIVLSDIYTSPMPEWQQNIKRILDVTLSIAGLIFSLPAHSLCRHTRVRINSPGPVIYPTISDRLQRKKIPDL